MGDYGRRMAAERYHAGISIGLCETVPVYQGVEQQGSKRDFGSKVFALREAWDELDKSLPFSYIGFLDGDISCNDDFYETLIGEMDKDRKSGLLGGLIWEKKNGEWFIAHRNPEWCVGGAFHFFRKECSWNKPVFIRRFVMAGKTRSWSIRPETGDGMCG